MRIKKYYIIVVLTCLSLCHVAHGQSVRDSVKIYFKQGYSTLDISLGDNKAVLERIADSLSSSYADSIYVLREVTVIGSASPEGGIELNKSLSEKRANVLFDYLSHYGSLPASSKNFIYLGRDWQGLLQLVYGDDNVPFREEVVTLLEDIASKSKDGESVQDDNLNRLQNLRGGEPYRYMYRVLFPKLRASRMIVAYDRVWNPVRIAPLHKLDVQAVGFEGLEQKLTSKSPYVQTPPSPIYMSLKTNILCDALLTPNVGAEFYLGRGFTVAADWMYAWWNNDCTTWRWRVYGGDIAIRKWLGNEARRKPLTGHHVGVYTQALTYDILWDGKGTMAGEPGGNIFDRATLAVGAEYGYSLPIAQRLNLDFTLGAGYMWGKYYEYIPADNCYVWQATKKRRWIGPTKAEVSLVWLIGRGNINAEKGGRR